MNDATEVQPAKRSQFVDRESREQRNRTQLIKLLRERSLKLGNFRLASGRESHYYLDAKKVTLDAYGLMATIRCLRDYLDGHGNSLVGDNWNWQELEAVGGLAIGADPLVSGLLLSYGLAGRVLAGFLVRKEAKQHGQGGRLSGNWEPGMRTVILEDVVTTGGSALQAVEAAREEGLDVGAVVGLIDRLEGGREAVRAAGLRFGSVLTVRDLGIEPLQIPPDVPPTGTLPV